ncbi:MAG: hypothetical protein HKN82_12200 [Akkermansiaceae bacterium]|nr:hypothetical protein [Akkermansiaceae bacterium]NNM27948.1 hypothetical protein [Akkermansiaceae bacterium]
MAVTEILKRSEAVANSLAALMRHDVETAVDLSSSYFGGAGSLYERETSSVVRFILDHEWSPDPAIPPEVLAPLRVVAAAMELWGQCEMSAFAEVSGVWAYAHDAETVTSLLYAAGVEQHRLQHLDALGVERVEIRSSELRPAPGCRATLGQSFPTRQAPLLPHDDPRCQCSYQAARPVVSAAM